MGRVPEDQKGLPCVLANGRDMPVYDLWANSVKDPVNPSLQKGEVLLIPRVAIRFRTGEDAAGQVNASWRARFDF